MPQTKKIIDIKHIDQAPEKQNKSNTIIARSIAEVTFKNADGKEEIKIYNVIQPEDIYEAIKNKSKRIDVSNCLITEFDSDKLREYLGVSKDKSVDINEFISWKVIIERKSYFKNITFKENAEFRKNIFNSYCDFDSSTFMKDTNFINAIFHNNSIFSNIIFFSKAFYFNSVFVGNTDFSRTVFHNMANFRESKFLSQLNCVKTKFQEDDDFSKVEFLHKICFESTTFESGAIFWKSLFHNDTSFRSVIFQSFTCFLNSKFKKVTIFQDATFEDFTDFNEVIFQYATDFGNSIFKGTTEFQSSKFFGETNFMGSIFQGDTDFWLTKFRGDALFEATKFNQTGIFIRLEAENLFFTGTVFEKSALFTDCKIENADRETFRIIKHELLKSNNKLDAYDYFKREMDEKRNELSKYSIERFFLTCYKYVNDYGTNFKKGILVTLALFVLFTTLFLNFGLNDSYFKWGWNGWDEFYEVTKTSIQYGKELFHPAHRTSDIHGGDFNIIGMFMHAALRIYVPLMYFFILQPFKKFKSW